MSAVDNVIEYVRMLLAFCMNSYLSLPWHHLIRICEHYVPIAVVLPSHLRRQHLGFLTDGIADRWIQILELHRSPRQVQPVNHQTEESILPHETRDFSFLNCGFALTFLELSVNIQRYRDIVEPPVVCIRFLVSKIVSKWRSLRNGEIPPLRSLCPESV